MQTNDSINVKVRLVGTKMYLEFKQATNLHCGNRLRAEHQEVQTPDVLQPRAVVDDEEHRLQTHFPLEAPQLLQAGQPPVPGHPQHEHVEGAAGNSELKTSKCCILKSQIEKNNLTLSNPN